MTSGSDTISTLDLNSDTTSKEVYQTSQDAKGQEDNAKARQHWFQLWRTKRLPPPAPDSLDDAATIPLPTVSILSQLTYSWLTDILALGNRRPLQASDLWKMDKSREAETVTTKLEAAWVKRQRQADLWNSALDTRELHPANWQRFFWHVCALRHVRRYKSALENMEAQWRKTVGRKEPSLTWALNDVFGVNFWLGGISKILSDILQLLIPIVIRAIINYAKERESRSAPSVAFGILMAIAMFVLTVLTSVFQHQFFWRSMTTGVLVRSALTSLVYKRGIMLTPKARSGMPNSRLVNFVSSDISRIDRCAHWFHPAWTVPIQSAICLAILVAQLGVSALAGFSLFVLMAPIQRILMTFQYKVRKASVVWTDRRAKLLLEIIGSMRIVKYFTYETPFLNRIDEIRKQELKGIVKIQFAQSVNYAAAFSLPVLSASLAFITYTETQKSFDPGVIFASFSLFALLRQPLLFYPRALSSVADAQSALARISKLLSMDTLLEQPITVDPDLPCALRVSDAIFQWSHAVDQLAEKEQDDPFRVKIKHFEVPRSQLVGIVGSFGSGKSSFLQGILGEMPQIRGNVSFGGSVSYCPQTAWVQNATLRENILFGQPWDEEKYWTIIDIACLFADLAALPAGDQTEIGEKGINLSGGQKQRINIARALYRDADIVIMDDPLSAVDAHVGRALFENAIIGHLCNRGKAVVLVTHALHFLSECDFIYTLNNGEVGEQGTYQDLLQRRGVFARLIDEFGASHTDQLADEGSGTEIVERCPGAEKTRRKVTQMQGVGPLEGRLIVAEKRDIGHVSWTVWKQFLKAGCGFIMVPAIVLFSILMQIAAGVNGYTLIWWQANTFDRPFRFYQVLYASLGVAQAVFTLLMGLSQDILCLLVSRNMHYWALKNVFKGQMSFFDTTPLGRIAGIFGKDIDTIDNPLPSTLRLCLITLSNLPGAIIIITIIEPYFVIAAIAVLACYVYLARFYGSSARELKRLDAILRSHLYAHFTESLSGLATIRTYGEIPRFIRDQSYYIDIENRALFLTVTNQRWLAIRLDALGAILTFVVALMAVIGVRGISAAQIGLALSYIAQVVGTTTALTRQQIELENYMNSVERVAYYSSGQAITAEKHRNCDDPNPPALWPTHGAIAFTNVALAYRDGLPDVLKGISMDVRPQEHVGIVGRTGAGKSSLTTALFRLVELREGSITIDGIDISKLNLQDLRARIAIIPQEPLLFSGTVRSNLDPFCRHEDARLWDALRRAHLISPCGKAHVGLDTQVEPEGANLSVGERSLLSLARALVKDSKIVILDEATASVDFETDSRIQETIQTEFADRTLLCVAHRLRTILAYDRILVLDSGKIGEFDTPLKLYANAAGIFHGMCTESGISEEEITSAAAARRTDSIH